MSATATSSTAHCKIIKDWIPTAPAECCDWKGIECNGNGDIIWLDLHGMQLQGPIPDAIGNIQSLKLLFLQGNKLQGLIPSSIGNLQNLTWISLHDNMLTGSIPPTFGNLKYLSDLYLENNMLSGEIPATLQKLASIRQMNVSRNFLQGSIALAPKAQISLGGNCFSQDVISAIPQTQLLNPTRSQRAASECAPFQNVAFKPMPPHGGYLDANWKPTPDNSQKAKTIAAWTVPFALLFAALIAFFVFFIRRRSQRKVKACENEADIMPTSETARLTEMEKGEDTKEKEVSDFLVSGPRQMAQQLPQSTQVSSGRGSWQRL
ncbi:hypothetical protein HDU97_001606 [Phlyctochytrium planicorne]|nr:hypothetical protein HDU97_001606 [Phlyctochytrium planicorne]